MIFKEPEKFLLLFILGYGTMGNVFATESNNSCSGSGALLNFTHRGAAADSACTLPSKTVMLEAGYLYTKFADPTFFNQNYPQLILTAGLPKNSEVVFYLPIYNQQTKIPVIRHHRRRVVGSRHVIIDGENQLFGYDAFVLGIKHLMIDDKKLIIALESEITPPGGSAGFGTKKVSAVLNGVANYTINDYLSLVFELGASSISLPALAGDLHYQSINPDVVFTYAPTEKFNIYGEIYGQSKTGPGQGSGFNMDYGVLYLIRSTVALDLEVGYPVSGKFNGNYLGCGITMWFK